MHKYVNMRVAMEYLGGLQNIYQSLGNSFVESYKNMGSDLNKYFLESDEYNLHLLVHTLKGITLNLGAVKLNDACKDFLIKLRNDILVQEDVTKIIEVFNLTNSEIKEEILK